MGSSNYESPRVLAEYLLFHYGAPEQILPFPFGPRDACEFPVRCVTQCLDFSRLPPDGRALDLGCAVGRSTFELARHATQVIGIDRSQAFIEAAQHLQATGLCHYTYTEEGELQLPGVARVPPDVDRSRVSFECGDAQRLRPGLGQFQVLLMANLLDRLENPASCLEQLPDLLTPGAQLVITSPYTWLEEFTPRRNWLGGFETGAERVTTFESLQKLLAPAFALERRLDLPFLLREHARKFQWGVADATLWIRR